MTIQKVARFVVFTCLCVIPFIALYVSTSLYFPFITGKNFAFRILVEIAAMAWIILMLVDRKYRPRFSWTMVLYIAFVVWMFIADAFAVSPLKAFWSNFERMDGWVTLIHVFLFFLITGSVLSADHLWRRWSLVFIASSALVSVYSILQLFGVLAIHQGGARVDGTLGNAIYLAIYLIFVIGLCVWQGIESKGWLRYTLFVLTGIDVVLVYFTATRGAILGLLAGILLALVLFGLSSGKKVRNYTIGAVAVLLVLVGGLYLARNTGFVQHEPTLARVTSIGSSDLVVRGTLWHMAWEGSFARPITGWGQEGFNYVFNAYYDPSLYGQEQWFDRAHSEFVDLFVAGGPVAMFLFIALLIMATIALYRKSVNPSERIIFTAVLVAYAIQAIVEFDNLFSYIPLAAFLALAHTASSRPWKFMEKIPTLSAATAGAVATPVVVVVGVVVFWFVNVPNIMAAHDLLLAVSGQSDINTSLQDFKDAFATHSFGDQEITEQLGSFAIQAIGDSTVSTDTKNTIANYAAQQLMQEIQARPKDARIYLEAALMFRSAGDFKDALALTQKALSLSPEKQNIMFDEGITEWELGDTALAHQIFDQALALAPGYDDANTYAAAGDILVGDIAGGKALLQNHFGTTLLDSDVLIFAYGQVKDYADIITLLESRMRTSPSPSNGFELAAAYVQAGRIADARALITAVIQAYPDAAQQGQALLSQLNGK